MPEKFEGATPPQESKESRTPREINYGNPWEGEGWKEPIKPEIISDKSKGGLKKLIENRAELESIDSSNVTRLLAEIGAADITEVEAIDLGRYNVYCRKFYFKKDGKRYCLSGSNNAWSDYGPRVDWRIFDEDTKKSITQSSLGSIESEISEGFGVQVTLPEMPTPEKRTEFDPLIDRIELTQALHLELEALKESISLPDSVPLPSNVIIDYIKRDNGKYSLTSIGEGQYGVEARAALSTNERDSVPLTIPLGVREGETRDFFQTPKKYLPKDGEVIMYPVNDWRLTISPDGVIYAAPEIQNDFHGHKPTFNFPPLEVGRIEIKQQMPAEIATMLGIRHMYTTVTDAERLREELRNWLKQ